MKKEIKHRVTGEVLFSCEASSLKEAVLAAIKDGVSLRWADLRNVDLSGADLRNVDLSGADLSGADLRNADLRNADLRNADLRSADLIGANLIGANLIGANLRSADLRNADLSFADLSGADLRNADLRSADLSFADLRSAYLRNVNLRSADLSGADLSGVYLSDSVRIKSGPAVIGLSGCGSVGRQVFAFNTDSGIYFRAGCFFGTLEEFRAKVLDDERGDNTTKKAMQYLGFANIAAISFDQPNEVQS